MRFRRETPREICLPRRAKQFRAGLYENRLSGEECEVNAASQARTKSQQKGHEICG
jgi:hypothetical protein